VVVKQSIHEPIVFHAVEDLIFRWLTHIIFNQLRGESDIPLREFLGIAVSPEAIKHVHQFNQLEILLPLPINRILNGKVN
jgi:hypothetical protein